MKKESTSDRLRQIMSERNLRQVDILEMCKPYCQKYNVKLGRNDLSQYVTGKVEPGQKKLTVLGMALNVSEAWLMGFDVPISRTISDEDIGNTFANDNLFEIIDNISTLSPQEKNHFTNYLQLLDINRKKADDYVEQLLSIQQMDQELRINTAHSNTDIDTPENAKTTEPIIDFVEQKMFDEIARKFEERKKAKKKRNDVG